MANDNETVAEIVKRVRRECNSYPLPNATGERLKLVREIDDAHKREISRMKGERKGILKANESLAADNTRLRNKLAEKDAEIEDLKKENASLRVINCGNYYADEQLHDDLAAKDAEIARLRALVKELADELDNYPCHNCKHGSERCEWCGKAQELDALVARAREVAK